jgi:hypothetical protein
VRIVSRNAAVRGLALSGGRVLFERVLRGRERSELVLRTLGAGGGVRLARFGRHRRRVGGIDLDASRATWATQRERPGGVRRGRARIVVRGL